MQLTFTNDQWSLLVALVRDVHGIRNNYAGEVEDDSAGTKATWDATSVIVTLPD